MRLLPTGLLAILLATPALAETAPLPATDAPRRVVTEIVTSATERVRDFPGIVEASQQTILAFQTAGRIAERPVELGDVVKAGDTLATLDETTLIDDRSAAEAAVRSAEAQAEFARQSFDRVVELNRRGVATNEQLDTATADRDAAGAALDAANADLERAQEAARYATLTAPADGVIIEIQAEAGSIASAGTPVVTLAAGQGREVVIDVPSEILPLLQPGARFLIDRRVAGTEPIGGTLRLIEPVADGGARTHRLRIALDTGSVLRLGSLVSVRLDLPPNPLLSLPRAAIGPDDMVWRVGEGRALEQVKVTTGAQLSDRVVVTGGIAEGDEVLIRGIHSVSAGQVVGEGAAQ
ncbi:MAG: efflux RND transporter periplasmic adaptor subunit [Candidatus Devosia phytovorans]|uniref:Efflux RND transporter periplasmic adaptor subunit n=1 Tax=Candidatus Devosia phytovorans TaxID=3121372 RepID=A0AAJ5VWU0_9HYPH|nr:efflux RND transporter periplasmic adaptor subunit [Devosia sp.]WEK04937.1 MAG: efflux RND transporter periplasmic adaptor subunit [Devosia sp.]